MIISYKGWTMVWSLRYIIIKCDKNRSLVLCIDWLAIGKMHGITETSKLSTDISYLIFVSPINDKYIVDYITTYINKMVAWSFDDYSKIETTFGGDWSFFRPLRSINCWWLGKRWAGFWWVCGPTFWVQLK